MIVGSWTDPLVLVLLGGVLLVVGVVVARLARTARARRARRGRRAG
jgi:uncharacterized integral membrane protein